MNVTKLNMRFTSEKKSFLSYLIISILLFTASYNTYSQNTTSDASSDKLKDWQKGYIVMRTNGDTLHGLVKIKQGGKEFSVRWIDFKINDGGEKIRLGADSVIAFIYDDIVWRHFKYCQWSKRIVHGTIDVYKGRALNMGADHNYSNDCLVFKKGNQKAKFISVSEIKIFSGNITRAEGILRQDAKEKFEEYIDDNSELLAEFEKETFRYEELESLIIKYNEWSKKTNK